MDDIIDIGERLRRELPAPPTNDAFDRLLARIKEAELRQHGQIAGTATPLDVGQGTIPPTSRWGGKSQQGDLHWPRTIFPVVR